MSVIQAQPFSLTYQTSIPLYGTLMNEMNSYFGAEGKAFGVPVTIVEARCIVPLLKENFRYP